MMSITPEVIAEIRARHEELEQRGHLAYHDWASEAHADRATLLLALTEAQERAERAEEALVFANPAANTEQKP